MKRLIAAVVILTVALALNAWAGVTDVTFDWDASSGAVGYKLYQGTVSGGPYTMAKDCGATKPCVLTAIPDGTYFWVATAYDQAGNESGYSNQVTKALDATAPNAPGNFKISVTVNVAVSP